MLQLYRKTLGFCLVLLITQIAAAQTVLLHGTVRTRSDGQGLPGATVRIKGSSKGTQTDSKGQFTLSAQAGEVLSVSSIGFEPRDISISAAQTELQIVLNDAPNSLNEVVITALNISKDKKSLGYAIQALKSKDISEAKEPNLVNALAGKLAGVQVTNSQGDMGSSRIIIRGETSIAGNNQPLFVVDGTPVDNSQLQKTSDSRDSRDFANAIADLNPEDIESITVLKGPNAAALYGYRASAGVILIKTKSGQNSGGLGVSVTSSTTFANLLVLPKYQNQYGQGSNGTFSFVDGKGAGINDAVDESWGPPLDGRVIPQFYSGGKPVPFVAHPNNVRDFFRTGYTLSNGVALSGSGADHNFRLSYNNLYQSGVVPNSSQQRNNFALNASWRLNKKLTLNTVADYIQDYSPNLPGAGGRRATSTMLQFTWLGRQVDFGLLKNHNNPADAGYNWNNAYYSNPYFVAYQNTVSQNKNRLLGNIELHYDIAKGLSANFRTGTDFYNDRRKYRIAYGTNGTPFGSYEEDAYFVQESNHEARLQYTGKLGPDWRIDVLAGGNIGIITNEENDQVAPKLAVAGLYTLSNSRDPLQSSNNYSKLKTYSAFSSAQIGFKNYAFLNLTARNDWSSSLPASHLSYFYPSVNASLVLSEMLDLSGGTLSYAKLRGGWSKVGKATTPYQLLNTYTFTAPFGSSPQQSASLTDLNTNLKPETTTSTEAGLELGLFHDRIRLDLSVYNTSSINQILSVNVSPSTGYTNKLINGGNINNKGLEVQLNLVPVKSKNFSWDVGFNYSLNRSKVLSLDAEGRLQSYVLGSNRTVQVLAAVGKPYGELYGNAYQRSSSGAIVTRGGIPVINPSKQYLGKFTPNYLTGITNSFTYKGLNLTFLVDARVGGSIYSNTNRTGTYTGVMASTLPGRGAANGGLNYYYPGNVASAGAVQVSGGSAPGGSILHDDGMIFKGVNADGTTNTTIVPAQSYYKGFTNVDEAFVYDASYVKLREVRLSWSLPGAWVHAAGLQSATFAVVGRNLWIIYKKVPNIDPETAFNTSNAQGLEDLTLPTVRNIGFNLNFRF